ncbi:class I adenylate-forming enzyme family protein [Xanthobacteraceae bacterium Astr-EGSB]|uniref:AMP-binding protein n=1 Tax=Astrobacterium formosum TaxID=3069710 RepID=UPI0027B2BA80|nr:class I adenylate-forming enzyme family protein [Xanthobacteraceae bacterium Astr-EGSB]
MILGSPSNHQMAAAGSAGRATLDDMFARAVARRPDAVALIDPPDREVHLGGPRRRLTYAEADRVITAIAARLQRMGLQTDQVVALQLPNTVEAVLTLLGVLRAGLIATPIPLLWRTADAVAALSQVGARVLIAGGQVANSALSELAMHVAAEVFPIRYVAGYGEELPDGVVSLNDVFADASDTCRPMEREGNPAAHVAVITWDVGPDGLIPVARSHYELMSTALAIVLEARIDQEATLLSAMATASLGGLAMSLLPWLVVGGTLSLHHPFDAEVFGAQCEETAHSHVFVPGPLAARLAETGLLSRRRGQKSVIAAWRAPERLAGSPLWTDRSVGLVDIQTFGEIGLIAARRSENGKPAAISMGPVSAPRGAPGAFLVLELARTGYGSLAMRGPMVPRFAFPPGSESGFRLGDDGFIDTGYGCRIDRDGGAMTVTTPPPGLISVGGYRFAIRDLQDLAARLEPGGTLAALPDRLGGHRLAGSVRDRDGVREALERLGVNPLVAGAFRERRTIAA